MNSIPWIEKYRPLCMDSTVIDSSNRRIFNNILKCNNIPNLLLYGPPGTGKTTTIINLIAAYQRQNKTENNSQIIHLNASDDRGIDIVRNQIYMFVSSMGMFASGMKFVILDEIDYMTKSAQQALKSVIEQYSNNVKYCIMCNYISKVDDGLKDHFIPVRYNQLPQNEIINFLENICKKEGQKTIKRHHLVEIQTKYKSDIRSMLNYLQCHQYVISNTLNDDCYKNVIHIVKLETITHKKKIILLNEISCKYNTDIKEIILNTMSYILKEKIVNNTLNESKEFMTILDILVHSTGVGVCTYINYFIDHNKYL
jgi:DNA polymerase III delta prime subunit